MKVSAPKVEEEVSVSNAEFGPRPAPLSVNPVTLSPASGSFAVTVVTTVVFSATEAVAALLKVGGALGRWPAASTGGDIALQALSPPGWSMYAAFLAFEHVHACIRDASADFPLSENRPAM